MGSEMCIRDSDRAVQSEGNSSVSVNNFEGARMAVNHLVDIGCKKIAHISGPKSVFPAQRRLKGYLNVVENLGYESIVYEGDFTLKSGTDMTNDLLSSHKDIDGVFYANDLMAIGALKTFRKHQVRIPEDIAVIGFDGIQLTEMVNPEISTIKQPVGKIGEIAENQLIATIEKTEQRINQFELDVELIVRESSGG